MLQVSANIAGNAVKLRVFDRFSDVEAEWKAFQKTAVTTPYQCYEWLEPWHRHVGSAAGIEPVLAFGEANGEPAFLWPFGLQRAGRLRTCEWMGGKQCNYNFGLYSRSLLSELDTTSLRPLLVSIADAVGGIDGFELFNQPLAWNGLNNPFAGFERQASPSPCYRVDLKPDFDALEVERRSKRSIQTLRRKARKLATEHGDLRCIVPADPAEYETVFDAFLEQRAARFAVMGVHNIFTDTGMTAFLREVSAPRADGEAPLVNMHALLAGDRICATYSGLTHGGQYSCFSNSIEEEFGRYSPGEILLRDVIETHCLAGLDALDLGMGTERYKQSWCDPDPLFDCFIPMTLLGGLQKTRIQTLLAVKRTIRSSPHLWSVAKAVRKRLNRA
ncbi:MAG: GNAT family N-acetyltransferase [Pseudomonadota bacterium]